MVHIASLIFEHIFEAELLADFVLTLGYPPIFQVLLTKNDRVFQLEFLLFN